MHYNQYHISIIRLNPDFVSKVDSLNLRMHPILNDRQTQYAAQALYKLVISVAI